MQKSNHIQFARVMASSVKIYCKHDVNTHVVNTLQTQCCKQVTDTMLQTSYTHNVVNKLQNRCCKHVTQCCILIINTLLT